MVEKVLHTSCLLRLVKKIRYKMFHMIKYFTLTYLILNELKIDQWKT